MISFDFSDVPVVVTGAGSGIGLAIAQAFHGAGARVALAACRTEISEIGFPGAAFLAIVAPVAELRFAIGA
jgi:NAD(P)-dependent dehydrogenase (short-subunit alcohol dehydrogenase family)